MAVRLSRQALDSLREHAAQGYPLEVCGMLVGRFQAGDVDVARARRAPNASKSERHARFVLHPRDLLAADDELAGSSLEVVGFYHSHPDVPAAPSLEDGAHAWPGYVHVIVSVIRGEVGHVSAWRTKTFGGPMVEETFAITAR